MKSLILSVSARLLFPVLIGLSLIILYRGHNLPGGGFIGGLTAAAAFILLRLAESNRDSVGNARAAEGPGAELEDGSMSDAPAGGLKVDPIKMMVMGLTVALISGVPGLFTGAPFMSGLWLPGFTLPLLGSIHLGTPLVFDIGVFLTVFGFVLLTSETLVQSITVNENQ